MSARALAVSEFVDADGVRWLSSEHMPHRERPALLEPPSWKTLAAHFLTRDEMRLRGTSHVHPSVTCSPLTPTFLHITLPCPPPPSLPPHLPTCSRSRLLALPHAHANRLDGPAALRTDPRRQVQVRVRPAPRCGVLCFSMSLTSASLRLLSLYLRLYAIAYHCTLAAREREERSSAARFSMA